MSDSRRNWWRALGLQAPVVQAPMAGAQDHRLALAVAQGGGLGSLPAAMLTPATLAASVQAFRSATRAPLNVNFFCHAPPADDADAMRRWHEALKPHYVRWQLDHQAMPSGPGRRPFDAELAQALAPFGPEVVSFHFGLPAPALLETVKSWGSQVWASATTVDEARWLQAHGADVVIAQGWEAGGHRGHFLSEDLALQSPLWALLPQVVQAIDLPVIAAGGLGAAANVARARQLGAAGVQLGSAYLCCTEAQTSALHRAALRQRGPRGTAVTRLLTGRPARGVVNGLMQALGPLSPLAPAFPLATAALAPLRAAAEAQGCDDYSPLWAGEGHTPPFEGSATPLTEQWVQAWRAAATA